MSEDGICEGLKNINYRNLKEYKSNTYKKMVLAEKVEWIYFSSHHGRYKIKKYFYSRLRENYKKDAKGFSKALFYLTVISNFPESELYEGVKQIADEI